MGILIPASYKIPPASIPAIPYHRGTPSIIRKNKINTGMPDKLQYSKSSTHTHIFP